MGRRYEQLDALRGLAALTVVFDHCLLAFPIGYAARYGPKTLLATFLRYTPVHMLVAGHEAVLLFFVLSGFVLALPFSAFGGTSYTGFALKRIARIWIPYIATVAVAVAARASLNGPRNARLSPWFNEKWSGHVTPMDIAAHVSLIGLSVARTNVFDPVLWSLSHELRLSLVFPALMLLIYRVRWQTVLAGALLLSALAIVASHYIGRDDYLLTPHYALLFVVGAELAVNRETIIRWYGRLPRASRTLGVIGAIAAYSYAWLLPSILPIHLGPTSDWVVTAAVAVFLITALASSTASKMLNHRVLLYFGRISYSLYLLHAVVLLVLLRILYGAVPNALIGVLTIGVSVVAATVSYLYVERPAIRLGRRISNWFPNARTSPTRS